jgi:DNA (cytosine-5)-methyltransferase 1
VDIRDLNGMDNQQGANGSLRELALFAGAGGGILGGKLLGWKTVCAVEIDPYAANVLVARQNDGCLEPFPIWDDVRTFNGKPWRGLVDVVSGGFPCQDISCAGKGAGITGKKSGLWTEFARIIREVQPAFAFMENSPMLTVRGLGNVIGCLAEMGYNAEWGVVSANEVGAHHERERIWIVAYSNERTKRFIVHDENGFKMEREKSTGFFKFFCGETGIKRRTTYTGWDIEPGMARVVYGLANRVHRNRAIGNGQVPAVAATAWRILTNNIR